MPIIMDGQSRCGHGAVTHTHTPDLSILRTHTRRSRAFEDEMLLWYGDLYGVKVPPPPPLPPPFQYARRPARTHAGPHAGRPVLWYSHLRGVKVRGRVAGGGGGASRCQGAARRCATPTAQLTRVLRSRRRRRRRRRQPRTRARTLTRARAAGAEQAPAQVLQQRHLRRRVHTRARARAHTHKTLTHTHLRRWVLSNTRARRNARTKCMSYKCRPPAKCLWQKCPPPAQCLCYKCPPPAQCVRGLHGRLVVEACAAFPCGLDGSPAALAPRFEP